MLHQTQEHHIEEDDDSGIPQSFYYPEISPPSPTTLDKHFVVPLHEQPLIDSITFMASNGNYAEAPRMLSPIESLPVEIFGTN